LTQALSRTLETPDVLVGIEHRDIGKE
jgi:hypothetical protein